MEIERAKKYRHDLEREIESMINTFMSETGLRVDDMVYTPTDITRLGDFEKRLRASVAIRIII